jgi:hypothetical protein
MDVATGEVLTKCRPRHRHQEFLGFLRQIKTSVPEDLDIHLVVDNYCTHKHGKVRTWLAQRPRFHVNYTPTYASWLNQVERCYRFAGLRLRDHHPASDSARQLLQRQGADRQDRAVRARLQQDQGTVQLNRHGRFNPAEAPATLLANLRDGTLDELPITCKAYIPAEGEHSLRIMKEQLCFQKTSCGACLSTDARQTCLQPSKHISCTPFDTLQWESRVDVYILEAIASQNVCDLKA